MSKSKIRMRKKLKKGTSQLTQTRRSTMTLTIREANTTTHTRRITPTLPLPPTRRPSSRNSSTQRPKYMEGYSGFRRNLLLDANAGYREGKHTLLVARLFTRFPQSTSYKNCSFENSKKFVASKQRITGRHIADGVGNTFV